ncbi:uncharacterized protein BKA55DRAFT_689769 [Fusarium redolens]|uniref:Uncharacterized protein n=1 Tax=Fusarium redolens TaxID=48865 RepID=A0A9P9HAP5_FUSRE|nr:uncharacterized protein BKA55DRAFT_689769 [Fusarium redolens]KAH7254269.1 hypothetical protein BKA55DRAFT_689769 [Fusarium redolens]
MAQKNYLECSPRRRLGEPSTGARFSGPVPTAEQLEQVGARRRHISDYIAFIRPEISHIISEYGRAAIKRVCQELYATGVRATPSPWFRLMCERTMWRLCFDPLGDDAPEWPWGHVKYPSVLAQGERPNGEFETYCHQRMVRDAGVARMNEFLKAQAGAAAAARAADPNNKFIVTSQAPLHNDGDPLPCNAVGPFEVEPNVPLERHVAKDLAAINELLPPSIAVKMNATNKRVFVTIVESEHIHPIVSARQTLLEVWEIVRSWEVMINTSAEGEVKTLLQHFQGVKEDSGLSWSSSVG